MRRLKDKPITNSKWLFLQLISISSLLVVANTASDDSLSRENQRLKADNLNLMSENSQLRLDQAQFKTLVLSKIENLENQFQILSSENTNLKQTVSVLSEKVENLHQDKHKLLNKIKVNEDDIDDLEKLLQHQEIQKKLDQVNEKVNAFCAENWEH